MPRAALQPGCDLVNCERVSGVPEGTGRERGWEGGACNTGPDKKHRPVTTLLSRGLSFPTGR